MKNIVIGLIILGVIGAGAYFLTQNKGVNQLPVGQVQPTVMPVAEPEAEATPLNNISSRTIEVKGSEYSFAPKAIDLSAGETASIKFTNIGNLPHDFVISDLGAKTKVLAAGQSETITVTAAKAGSYAFYCDVGNHKQLGMEGKVSVK